jgi:hypothetical protein
MKYRLIRGSHGRHEPGEDGVRRNVRYQPGDEIELTAVEAKGFGDRVELAGPALAGVVGVNTADTDLEVVAEVDTEAVEVGTDPEPEVVDTPGDAPTGWSFIADEKARDAIEIIRGLDDPDEVSAALDAEDAGKARKSVMAAGEVRLLELED